MQEYPGTMCFPVWILWITYHFIVNKCLIVLYTKCIYTLLILRDFRYQKFNWKGKCVQVSASGSGDIGEEEFEFEE